VSPEIILKLIYGDINVKYFIDTDKKRQLDTILNSVKDINTVRQTLLCGCCYCSGVHDPYIYVTCVCCMRHTVWHVVVGNHVLSNNRPCLCQVNCTVY
jgi:hypothetical protein